MGKAEKLFLAMKDNPAANWQIADVETLAAHYGLAVTAPRGGDRITRSESRAMVLF